jgi:hypothetical protein
MTGSEDEELAVSRYQGKISWNQGISYSFRPTDEDDDCSQMSSIRLVWMSFRPKSSSSRG